MNKRAKQAKVIRFFRKAHRITGIYLFVLFFILSISGLLLGWKKHSKGLILPRTEIGVSTNPNDWLPLSNLQSKALESIKSKNKSITEISRIDIRPEKGIAKFIFKNEYWELQMDCTTAKVLAINKRHSDWLEDIHDGSILDDLFKTRVEIIKLFYTTSMGCALILFTITGFWLWMGPKRMKKLK
ncbi:PepSY domain-containing protein [Tamlana crocina]|uniref:PepSY domain-containing protein n=1 Tax=Tamlana crocina TaxID=393006 RepID=A0ABX1DJ79_9FLAO|nr:PepSY domain-containing protein [Tamlana crocina]NJX16366.1 PepSY domain-containing protein [Tamlana crocina]